MLYAAHEPRCECRARVQERRDAARERARERHECAILSDKARVLILQSGHTLDQVASMIGYQHSTVSRITAGYIVSREVANRVITILDKK